MAVGDLSEIKAGSRVLPIGKKVSVRVSQALIGRVINDRGEPIDGKGPIVGREYPLYSLTPHPLKRQRISQPIDLGIRSINGLLTCGKGQRIGIMAGSGVGKSVLLGMMARYTAASVNVIAMIGERGREVREFIEKDLGEEGIKKSVIVVSTSEQPPLAKVRGALAATAIAEYFRDQGKRRAAAHGFPDPRGHGAARDRPCHGRTAHLEGLHALRVCAASQAPRAGRHLRGKAAASPACTRCSWKATTCPIPWQIRPGRFSTATSSCRASWPWKAITRRSTCSRASAGSCPISWTHDTRNLPRGSWKPWQPTRKWKT